MNSSAHEQAAGSDRLDRTLELYRDLSVALIGRIADLKAETGGDAACKEAAKALEAHWKSLQTVLDTEARLVKRTDATAGRAGFELDLDAARAEILARLAHGDAAG